MRGLDPLSAEGSQVKMNRFHRSRQGPTQFFLVSIFNLFSLLKVSVVVLLSLESFLCVSEDPQWREGSTRRRETLTRVWRTRISDELNGDKAKEAKWIEQNWNDEEESLWSCGLSMRWRSRLRSDLWSFWAAANWIEGTEVDSRGWKDRPTLGDVDSVIDGMRCLPSHPALLSSSL